MTSSTITTLLTIIAAVATTSHGFSNNIRNSSLHHRTNSVVTLAQQPQPNFGDWTNDDYLNNLGGGGGGDDQYDESYNNQYDESYDNSAQYENPPQQPQQNELTDEEITQWALNAASFYNTDTSVQEAYGIKRDGPPRREEGTEVDGW